MNSQKKVCTAKVHRYCKICLICEYTLTLFKIQILCIVWILQIGINSKSAIPYRILKFTKKYIFL